MLIEISKLLYGGKEFVMKSFPNIKMRQQGAVGFGLSQDARKYRTTPGTSKAKINTAALLIDYLLLGNANIASLASSIYIEYTNLNGETYSASCDGNKIHFKGNVPTDISDSAIPFIAYALGNNSKMAITKDAFTQLKSSFLANRNAEEDVYRFCDAFYYEFLGISSETNISIDNFLDENLITQAARTNQTKETLVLSGLKLPTMDVLNITKKKNEEAKAIDDANTFEACRIGEYLIDHLWAPERKVYIPDLSVLDDFVPDHCFYTMTKLISHELGEVKKRIDKGYFDYRAIEENYVNAQLIGRPGTGKTTIANALAATFGLPIRVIINSKNTEEDSYQGMTKVQDGSFQFVETPFLDAYKNGGIILLEEINLTDPGITMGVLGQALEKPFILLEDGYKEIRRHPLCVVIATANTGTQGSREPSEALTSRMPNVFLIDDPEKERFIDILATKNKKVTRADCEKVYSAYTKVLNYLTSSGVNAEDVALSLCLRHCIAALKQIEIGIPFKEALSNTLIGTIGIKDLELARETQSNVIDVLV